MTVDRYTERDRKRVLEKIASFLDHERLRDVAASLYEEFYGDLEQQPDYTDPETMDAHRAIRHRAFLFWAFFDAERKGQRLVDAIVAGREPSAGERAYLRAMREARLRLYEVVSLEPGYSVTLRDALSSESSPIKVRERLASRHLRRGELLATRIVPGASGQLELDGGLFDYSEVRRAHVLAAVEGALSALRAEHPEWPESELWRHLGPTLNAAWR